MTENTRAAAPANTPAGWRLGVRDALPLLGGYIPVAISFGLIAVQAGFSPLEATLISALIYAGASQFLFVAMMASGAPLWLVIGMTLLINARHLVYAPNLAPYIPPGRHWLWLMHGLTDQIFALAHTRLPQLPERERLGWYCAAALIAWLSWILGTTLGAVAGLQITSRWPLLGEVLPFALPALFLVLLAPRFTSRQWTLTLSLTQLVALMLKWLQLPNAAIPLAALCGAVLFYLLQPKRPAAAGPQTETSHG
jgi:4-azaleucine resistance transporter AzlC